MAQVAFIAKMAKDLNESDKALKLLIDSARPNTHGTPADQTSTGSITTSATDHDRTNKDMTFTDMPPLPMSPPPVQPPQSYSTPPAPPSVAKWLFKDHDFLFSNDRGPLDNLLRRANAPIDYSEEPEDLNEEIHPTLLATLDPLTQSEVHKLAHELQTLDALIIESKTKLELMESADFIAKVTRTKSKLLPHASIKDEPKTTALVDEFVQIHRQFQQDGTNVVKRYVELEFTTFHNKLIPTVLQGLFRLAKRMVADRKPQLQVNNILNMASLRPRVNEEIPESNETLAGYILMLLLTSPSSHVLVQWTGLDENTGAQDLFQRALNLHPACPTPLSTPARVNRDLDAEMNTTTAPDEGPSQDDGDAADQKPAATNNDDRAAQGDGDNNGDERDLYASQASQTTTEEATKAESQTAASSDNSVTIIGPCYFNLPSENGMQVVLAAARTLQPIVNYITLQQRIQLARRITKSKCLVAAKELHLKREMFNATNSVKELVDTLNLDSSRVLAVLTTWRRTFFEQLTKRMNKQLVKKTAKHNTTRTGNNSYHAPPRSPAVVDLSKTDDDSQDTPSNKRKKPPKTSHAKRAKNTQDEQPAALHSSPTRQQQNRQDDPNASARKPPPGSPTQQRHVRINDNKSQTQRQQPKSRQRKSLSRNKQQTQQQTQRQQHQSQRPQQQSQRQQQQPQRQQQQPQRQQQQTQQRPQQQTQQRPQQQSQRPAPTWNQQPSAQQPSAQQSPVQERQQIPTASWGTGTTRMAWGEK